MRFTSTAKRFSLFLLMLAVLTLLALYLIHLYPNISSTAGTVFLVAFACFLLYLASATLINFLGERADSIMAVYADASGKGLHIITSYSTSRGRVSVYPLRTIQYYFLVAPTHKLLHTVILKHNMQPLTGRSGYEGFASLKETVLQGKEFKTAREKYSVTAGWKLQPGATSPAGDDKSYTTRLNENTYCIETKKGFAKKIFLLCCYDEAKQLRWKKKL